MKKENKNYDVNVIYKQYFSIFQKLGFRSGNRESDVSCLTFLKNDPPLPIPIACN